MCLESLLLGAYIVTSVIHSLTEIFIKCPSISCLIQLIWVQPFHIFYGFSLYSIFPPSFPIKVFVFLIKCMTSIAVSCVFYQFCSLYILNGKLNPLIFMLLLKKVALIYTFAFYLLCLMYFFLLFPLACFLMYQVNILHILVSLMTSTIFLFSIMIIDKLWSS